MKMIKHMSNFGFTQDYKVGISFKTQCNMIH